MEEKMNKYYYDGFKNYVEMQKEAGRFRNALIGALKGGAIGTGVGGTVGGVGGLLYMKNLAKKLKPGEVSDEEIKMGLKGGAIFGGSGGGAIGGGAGALIGGIRGALKKQKLTRMQKVKKALGLNY